MGSSLDDRIKKVVKRAEELLPNVSSRVELVSILVSEFKTINENTCNNYLTMGGFKTGFKQIGNSKYMSGIYVEFLRELVNRKVVTEHDMSKVLHVSLNRVQHIYHHFVADGFNIKCKHISHPHWRTVPNAKRIKAKKVRVYYI